MTTEEILKELDKKIDGNYTKITDTISKLHSHDEQINDNSKRIQENTGALEILKTFKEDSQKFFIMWLVTFLALLGMIGYVVYLSNDIRTVTTQEVEQETDDGNNFFVGRDGDIEG